MGLISQVLGSRVDAGCNSDRTLPDSEPDSPDDFWKKLPDNALATLGDIYTEIVHWRSSHSKIYNNKVGKKFVDCINVALSAIANDTSEQKIFILAAMTMSHLVLIRTKNKEDGSVNAILNRPLSLWIRGNIMELFNEAKALHTRSKTLSCKRKRDPRKEFVRLMTNGNVAIRQLEEGEDGSVLDLSDRIGDKTVLQVLKEKHPSPGEVNRQLIESPSENVLPFHPSIFDNLDDDAIKRAATVTKGSPGHSGLDANHWKKMLTGMEQISVNLRKTCAKIARRIATETIAPSHLRPYNACRLIPLDKKPGVIPIGIGELLRRIIGRCIARCVSADLKHLGSNIQLCLGQKCGIEHAIHTLREEFDADESCSKLLIDASNAFNLLNRKLALENIETICLSLVTMLGNSYSETSDLLVNGTKLKSEEGTTQGDPLSMAMYGIAILPLIKRLNVTETSQKWCADDGNSEGEQTNLREVFRVLQEDGLNYGYFISGPKCQLITKKNIMEEAKRVFHNTGVQIGLGARVLGSVIGDASAMNMYCEEKVQKYGKMTAKLREFARSNPHPLYSCLTKGVQSKLSFMTRTTPEFHLKLDGVDNYISEKLIPTLTGRDAPNETQRQLLSISLRRDGLNIQMPSDYS